MLVDSGFRSIQHRSALSAEAVEETLWAVTAIRA